MLMVFGTFPIDRSKPQTNLSATLKVIKDFLKAVCVVVFVPYSLRMPQYETMNKKDIWLSCFVLAAPVPIPSDGNIYNHPPWTFNRVYAISYTATFWQRKIR
jgi:hypothetical protein